jgi:outer membrane protein assembly factor BamB
MRHVTRRDMLATSAAALALPLTSKLFGAAPAPSKPAEWTSFRNGPQLLGVSSAALPDKLDVLWTLDAPDGITATCAIVGGKVFVAGLSGELRRVDLKTGKVDWTYKSVENVKPNTFAPGFKSSPTVTEDTVYLGDEDGIFHAIDRETGRRKWTFETEGEIISSPTIDGDRVLFGSYDNTLYCLDRSSGKKLWGVETEGYVHCTPAVSGGKTFIAGCDEHLRAIDIATGEVVVDMPIGTYLIASPATRDGLLYFGTYLATVIAVDWAKQETVWTYEAGRDFPFQSSAAVTDEVVVAGARDKHVHAIDRKTGKGVWKFPTRSRVDSSPVIAGDRVYVGSSDRNLYCLDLKTGKEVWTRNIGHPVTASPAVGEGVLVIGGDGNDAKVFCFGQK